jgi:hypothetical protein
MSQVRHRCQVCRHPERWRLELLRAGGASLDSLAEKFNVDRDEIWRHWQNHVTTEKRAIYAVRLSLPNWQRRPRLRAIAFSTISA